uniref:thioredoxin family protein n=1 Tax=uncultured Draconibacterium sp. TaxID=1573823 RepID=UPI00321728BB
MKFIYTILILFAVSLSAAAQGINFEHSSLEEAIKKAKDENKILFIDGYAVWCGPCKKMASTVFKDEEVGKFFDENLIALKVDVERGEGPMIKRRYGITALPGYVFIDGDGLVVYRFGAYMQKDAFMKEVKLALEYANDSNSVGRLAERYVSEKNDEKFVRKYLDILARSQSTNYTEVLEHYLSIQTSMKETDKEMVEFLAQHYQEIVFGGIADEIVQRNLGSEIWKLYVRKDVRAKFQKLPRSMVEKTTDYAILKKDTTILDIALDRAVEAGVKRSDETRKRAYTYYYLNAGEGEKYKAMVHDDIVNYINSLDVQKLRDAYLDNLKRRKEGDVQALATRPYAFREAQTITGLVNSYSKFVVSDEEKSEVVAWMKTAYDLLPGDATTMSDYGNILYLFGNDKAKAIEIKEEAYEIALNDTKDHGKSTGILADIELMKSGEKITVF